MSMPKDATWLRRIKQFDADWYANAYPDVALSGMDPAAHYLQFGIRLQRDPGPDCSLRFLMEARRAGVTDDPDAMFRRMIAPDPDRVTKAIDPNALLWAAERLAGRGRTDLALRLAARYARPELAHSVAAMRANVALGRGDVAQWLLCFNQYLAHYHSAPIRLQGHGSLLERLQPAQPVRPISGGPKVSVIMAVWNGARTVTAAAQSILRQSWQNLELLIVDDASSDETWQVVQALAATDKRVRLRRNRVNVGPYVSKNTALLGAVGDYVTGQDADDWSHPLRLEQHVAVAQKRGLRASQTLMVRVQPNGAFSQLGRVRRICPDAVARIAPISCLFERTVLVDKLGFWDLVRFGADSEMVHRAEMVLGDRFATLPQIGMICLDHAESLTNHPLFGNSETMGISDVRAEYRAGWKAMHAAGLTPDVVKRAFPLRATYASGGG